MTLDSMLILFSVLMCISFLPFVIDLEESGPGLVGGQITGMAILGLSPYKNTLIK